MGTMIGARHRARYYSGRCERCGYVKRTDANPAGAGSLTFTMRAGACPRCAPALEPIPAYPCRAIGAACSAVLELRERFGGFYSCRLLPGEHGPARCDS